MNAIETRIRENYPTILMTILSLIVALVYENLIGSMKERVGLFEVAPGVHRRSRRTLLAGGALVASAGIALQVQWVGFAGAALLLVLATPRIGIGVFVLWYPEWRGAVALRERPETQRS